jgi:two-component system, cell cycle sensor histidine kinase and response regulator CckA
VNFARVEWSHREGITVGSVLVVDDDVLVRNSIAAMLTSLKHTVIQAKDGLEALSVYKTMNVAISIVIMDVKMPILDGIEATMLIKEFNNHAKIILMSGYSEKIPSKAKPAAFIAKPFTRAELGEIVHLVMKSAS